MVCQEYGQQPRYYLVRDGQAAYNGGNSDRGWLIILERGSVAIEVSTQISYSVSSSGAYVKHINDEVYRRFVPDGSGNPRRFSRSGAGIYSPDSSAGWVKTGPGSTDGNFLRVTSYFGTFSRYDRTETRIETYTGGGGYFVRWAHMAWCRA